MMTPIRCIFPDHRVNCGISFDLIFCCELDVGRSSSGGLRKPASSRHVVQKDILIFFDQLFKCYYVKSTHFQWVVPLAGLLRLGRKTSARDRLTDLAYRNNSRLRGVGRQNPCHNS